MLKFWRDNTPQEVHPSTGVVVFVASYCAWVFGIITSDMHDSDTAAVIITCMLGLATILSLAIALGAFSDRWNR